ncbi:MAG: glutathione S-transferase family protein [Gammaproteobacteria bacterium]|nr:glutathione S-transferase family protein [Gammaproteobacteria bacterium]
MKLITADASPFVRKVRILILELGLQDAVTLVDPGQITPISNNDSLNAINPLGLIPALELDDGDSLTDSPLICEYLNQLAGGPFFPSDADRRFKTLRLQALADGILDLSVALRYETAMRPAELQWQTWIDNQNAKIERALDVLESRCGEFEPSPLIGEITVACALGYRDFRFADKDWRSGRPALTQWFEQMMQRESLASTVPA